MRGSGKSRQGGFTLIELLTVIGILCVMVAVVMTAVVSAQESGRLASCRNNLRQIQQLILQYGATYGGYMPAFWHDRWVGELGLVGKPWGNLMDDANPNIPVVWGNFSELFQYVQDPDYASGRGGRIFLIRTPSPIVVCKSDAVLYRSDQGCVVSYLGLAKYGWWNCGNDGAYVPLRMRQKDGSWGPPISTWVDWAGVNNHYEYHQMTEFDNHARRILLTETDPATWQYQPGTCGCRWFSYSHPVDIQGRHYDGGNILFMDGHVDLIRDPPKMKIEYWEPGYTAINPEY